MKKVLIVVDYQYDFYHPDGALYVDGADTLQEKIEKIIPNFDLVIFTQDYHPLNHCSFSENGGIWPLHCVEGTAGSSIPLKLLKMAKKYHLSEKGLAKDVEEYGAFGNKNALKIILYTTLDCSIEECEFVICGLCLDYCVKATMINLMRCVPNYKISLYSEGTLSIDKNITYTQIISDLNIKEYEYY